jgi:CheY-like chemotaxis protein
MFQETPTKLFHPLVMLVDDSAIDNFVNKKVMARYNFTEKVNEFSKAYEALNYLAEVESDTEAEIPSILFLDLEMPQINGFEFLDKFEHMSPKMRKNISIVILTSSVNPADLERCVKHRSVLTYIHKPLMKNNLDDINSILLKKSSKLVMF